MTFEDERRIADLERRLLALEQRVDALEADDAPLHLTAQEMARAQEAVNTVATQVMSNITPLMLGHGHVRPRPDGSKFRCGGPGMCQVCSVEQAAEFARIARQPR